MFMVLMEPRTVVGGGGKEEGRGGRRWAAGGGHGAWYQKGNGAMRSRQFSSEYHS